MTAIDQTAERIAALENRNLALEGENVVLRAQLNEAAAHLTQFRAEAKTANDRAIEMMARVGQAMPVPPDPKGSAQTQQKKTLTQLALEKVGLA